MAAAQAELPSLDGCRIGLVGLGYVGWPLALAFGREFDTVCYDIDAARVDELRRGHDRTGESSADEFAAATRMRFATGAEALRDCNVHVVTVPTPVDEANRPDLGPLRQASRMLAGMLKRGDVVIYESTVYPGTTEEVCVPLLEAGSGLRLNVDFHCGYSPERINPGDREHTLRTIRKVTSGSNPQAADFVDALYRRIIPAGTHRASSIRVAEAAKVIENTQRDVNIALVNELAMIFNKMGIDTGEVLAAAGSKWNFLPFRPGLVGGHCIGVDPYYLTHKATVLGYHPELILAARRINSRMGLHVAHELLRLMARQRRNIVGARVLVLGLAFKEDCADLRNSRVIDIVRELQAANAEVAVHDPLVDPAAVEREYGLALLPELPAGQFDAAVVAVGHQRFRELGIDGLRACLRPGGLVYDVKHLFAPEQVDGRL
jgi:UDP-N-acetyl-D-galactosamine dehydrogenase